MLQLYDTTAFNSKESLYDALLHVFCSGTIGICKFSVVSEIIKPYQSELARNRLADLFPASDNIKMTAYEKQDGCPSHTLKQLQR